VADAGSPEVPARLISAMRAGSRTMQLAPPQGDPVDPAWFISWQSVPSRPFCAGGSSRARKADLAEIRLPIGAGDRAVRARCGACGVTPAQVHQRPPPGRSGTAEVFPIKGDEKGKQGARGMPLRLSGLGGPQFCGVVGQTLGQNAAAHTMDWRSLAQGRIARSAVGGGQRPASSNWRSRRLKAGAQPPGASPLLSSSSSTQWLGQIDAPIYSPTRNYRSHVETGSSHRFLAGLQLNKYRNLNRRPRLQDSQIIPHVQAEVGKPKKSCPWIHLCEGGESLAGGANQRLAAA